jgi:hypothetical protein
VSQHQKRVELLFTQKNKNIDCAFDDGAEENILSPKGRKLQEDG